MYREQILWKKYYIKINISQKPTVDSIVSFQASYRHSYQTELRLASAESSYWSPLAHFVSSSRAKSTKLPQKMESFS